METITGRQCPVLCHCRMLGCLQCHVGNVTICIDHTDPHRSCHRSDVTATGAPLFGTGCYICRTRFIVWKCENFSASHFTCDNHHSVWYVRGSLGSTTEEPKGETLTHLHKLAVWESDCCFAEQSSIVVHQLFVGTQRKYEQGIANGANVWLDSIRFFSNIFALSFIVTAEAFKGVFTIVKQEVCTKMYNLNCSFVVNKSISVNQVVDDETPIENWMRKCNVG